MAKPVIVVQGSQWGSEAKGTVAAWLCQHRGVELAVRTGGINAGHTVFYRGRAYKMQQIPTGWVNPHTELILGAGSYINRPILEAELEIIDSAMKSEYGSVRDRLYIDFNAGAHIGEDQEISAGVNRHHSIGATGKGVSEAIAGKILDRGRGPAAIRLFRDRPGCAGRYMFADTATMLNLAYDAGRQILIEGTQGNMLDLHHGPWPYTTGKSTVAAAWLAECGLSPSLDYEIVSVVRTYPIRVAGNSGPMPLEISWPILAREMNNKLHDRDLPPMVDEEALLVWDNVVHSVGKRHGIPHGSDATRQHAWSREDREKYAIGLSEIHAKALDEMRAKFTPQYNEICKLFEFTTVTKKLRRIARLDIPSLCRSLAIDRPNWIFLSFLNYEFPELRGAMSLPDPEADCRYHDWIYELESKLGVPIRAASTGPLPEHIISL